MKLTVWSPYLIPPVNGPVKMSTGPVVIDEPPLPMPEAPPELSGEVQAQEFAFKSAEIPSLWQRAWAPFARGCQGTKSGFKRGRDFIQSHWYLRWAPVFLGFGGGLVNTAYEGYQLGQERQEMSQPPPAGYQKEILFKEELSFKEGLEAIRTYPYRQDIVETLMVKLYAQTVTPEGATVLSHVLLETFSLSPALSVAEKNELVVLVSNNHAEALERFKSLMKTAFLVWMLTPQESLTPPEEVYVLRVGRDEKGKPTWFVADIKKEDEIDKKDRLLVGRLLNGEIWGRFRLMEDEKKNVSEMYADHNTWVAGQVQHPELKMLQKMLQSIGERNLRFDHAYTLDWDHFQAKVSRLDDYLFKHEEALKYMKNDFGGKNQGLWYLHRENWDLLLADSALGLAGFFGSGLLFKVNGWLLPKSFVVAGALDFYSASREAAKQARDRQPVTVCLPDYGALCEQLTESGISQNEGGEQ